MELGWQSCFSFIKDDGRNTVSDLVAEAAAGEITNFCTEQK